MESLIIQTGSTIIDGFKQMDLVGHKLLLMFNGSRFINLLSIGDLQRALLNGSNTNSLLESIEIASKQLAYVGENRDEIYSKMEKMRAEYIPIVTKDNKIEEILYWEDKGNLSHKKEQGLKDISVVIMAGGKGTRLRPVTNIIPKPLVPIGEKPIVECILDRFNSCGATNFLFSVNYKWEMIRDYFSGHEEYNIGYYKEEKPLGTAGSLSLMKNELNDTFFISNCDIIIEEDYNNILNYHRENNNVITLVACLKNYSIPYGIMTRTEDGLLDEMQEKPNNTYMINTGMYVVSHEVLGDVPRDTFFHITELISQVKEKGGRVGIFPISEGSWKDIGEWPEYLKNYVIDQGKNVSHN